MSMKTMLKGAMVAGLVMGVVAVAQADADADMAALEKALNAEIAQVKETTKAEVQKDTVKSVIETVKAAPKAVDAGSEAVVAAQEQPVIAEAKGEVDASSSFDVIDRVAERTAEALRIEKDAIGTFDHEKKRIVVVGFAEMAMDVKNDKKGDWALKRTMIVKSALINAKLNLATSLGGVLTAEEQQSMFGLPATPNTEEKKGIKTSSAIQFISSHPIMGATALLQEESLIAGIYRVAISMVWSEALQKSAVAAMCGTPGFKEEKKGKKTLGEWVKSQTNPYLLLGPRQYLDKDGVRHFLGISAMPVGRNTVLSQHNRRIAQLDALACAAFSCLADVNTAEAMDAMMAQYSDPNDINAIPTAEVQSSLNSEVSQKIAEQAINGVGMVFQKEIEHPLFPGGRLYVYCAELNAAGIKEARELGKKAYLERAKIAFENERFKAIKAKYVGQIAQAKLDGWGAGQRAKIEKYKTDDPARAKARLEQLKKIAAEAQKDKAAAKVKLEQVKQEMQAAGVYERYKKFVEQIDGFCSPDNVDPNDVNVD